MKNKKAQFFLLAAIILISLIAGIFLYTNQVFFQERREGITLLKEEIDTETGIVINQYAYSQQDNLEEFIVNMTHSLIYRDPSLEMLFFYKNDSGDLKIINFLDENVTLFNVNGDEEGKEIRSQKGNIRVMGGVGGMAYTIDFPDLSENTESVGLSLFQDKETLSFKINDIKYDLPWLDEKKFYFVIKQKEGEDQSVETG